MEAFDTNVLVRLLVRDDEDQCLRAERALRRVTAGPGVWVSNVVLAEIAWVLRGAYKFDRATTAGALHRLIAMDGVHVEDRATTRLALAAFEAGSADFADYFISESARRGGALPLHTFDDRLSRSDGAKLVD
ncbi:MAG: type II toxin-antitoxin system VapC family toxin [Polyangiaceae bacterium]|nr:type II toxin-antitoxin system VapC family toxin [Polyangiaceae bacterium]